MLDFDNEKCDLFHARKASFSIKILKFLNCELIVRIRVKISQDTFQRSVHIGGLYILKQIRSSLSQGTRDNRSLNKLLCE